MKYTTEQKRELVLRYQNGESVSDICTQTGIARSTLYSRLKPYQTTITEAGMVSPQKNLSISRNDWKSWRTSFKF